MTAFARINSFFYCIFFSRIGPKKFMVLTIEARMLKSVAGGGPNSRCENISSKDLIYLQSGPIQ